MRMLLERSVMETVPGIFNASDNNGFNSQNQTSVGGASLGQHLHDRGSDGEGRYAMAPQLAPTPIDMRSGFAEFLPSSMQASAMQVSSFDDIFLVNSIDDWTEEDGGQK